MKTTISVIRKIVCSYYEKTASQLSSRTREGLIIEARHIYFYLCRYHTVNTLAKIGKSLPNEKYDHATVSHGSLKIKNLLTNKGEGQLRETISYLLMQIKNHENTILCEQELLFKSDLEDIKKRLEALEIKFESARPISILA